MISMIVTVAVSKTKVPAVEVRALLNLAGLRTAATTAAFDRRTLSNEAVWFLLD